MASIMIPFIMLESIQGFARFYNLKEDFSTQQQWISSLLWFSTLIVFIIISVLGSDLWLMLLWIG